MVVINTDDRLGRSVIALLLIFAIFACGKKPTSSDNFVERFASGTHVIIGPQGNETDWIFNFGYAPQESSISHVFWLHNGCDDSLDILYVEPG